ncbi:hypothetical protein AB4Y78_14105 [Janibacter sp. RAF52]|uniref:hypothetical protein n=1 Tax=unclassified Janibacter TaxID=2649294 RepID=UPI003F8F34FB
MEEQLSDSGRSSTPLSVLQFAGMAALLDECIIRDSYKVPDVLVDPIRLTEAGDQLLGEFTQRNRKFRPNEAKLAVALKIGFGGDLFIHPETDTDSLRDGIGKEVMADRIKFPYAYGRDLHDAWWESFEGKTTLTAHESQKLLKDQPKGVVQYSDTVVGPFGCFKSRQPRGKTTKQRAFPAYRCPDERCLSVHWATLSTADNSQISRARTELHRILNAKSTSHSLSPLNFREDMAAHLGAFDLESAPGLIDLVADVLLDGELRSLAADCVRLHLSDRAGRTELQRTFSTVFGDPETAVGSMHRAQLISIILYFTDREIARSLDRLVDSNEIPILMNEIREPRIARSPGRSSARPQLSRNGFRISKPTQSAARLANLFRIVAESTNVDTRDLAFTLGLPEATTTRELEAYVYANASDERIIERALLGSRTTAEASARHLGLDQYATDRTILEERISWRLGFNAEDSHNQLHGLAKEALATLASTTQDGSSENSMRASIANCFVAIEEVLLSSLKFSAWALLDDHYVSDYPFRLHPDHNRYFDLDEALDLSGTRGEERIWQRMDKPSLAELGSAYGRLAGQLRTSTREDHRRPPGQLPNSTTRAGRPFFFPNSIPFTNLDESNRNDLLSALMQTARTACDQGVTGVRNAGLHGNTTFPTVEDVASAATSLESMLNCLFRTGLSPRVFIRTGSTTDALERKVLFFRNGGEEVQVPADSWAASAKLPSNQQRLVILPGGKLGDAGPLRFSLLPQRGDEKYWSGWPKKIEGESFSQHAEPMDADVGIAG